jgi:DNA repair photolyase
MPNCGSQFWLCDLPIHFDTYSGCSHDCKYCFARRKKGIENITYGESVKQLENFIKGGRNKDTIWCDWNIPLHFGGMSDPFQPAEKTHRRTYECLKLLAETKYPVIISTKGDLCIEPDYLYLLSKCNVCMQVSMACGKYDRIEQGAPSFERRLEVVKVLSKHVKRVNVRVQPYLHECFADVYKNIKRFADAGAYGVIFEGMKFQKKKNGLVKCGADMVYPLEVLKKDFISLRAECHKHGLKFYSGENRLRRMGDSLTCCGIDGLEGFDPNTYNLNHLLNGDKTEPRDKMLESGTGASALHSMLQNAGSYERDKKVSFKDANLIIYADYKKTCDDVFSVGKKI